MRTGWMAALAACAGWAAVAAPVDKAFLLQTKNTTMAFQKSGETWLLVHYGPSLGSTVDAAALAVMTAKDSAEANSAQFYALQFGRPGAPRHWAGDKGTTGTVAVGPYVRVNNLDCRDFTHTVKANGQDYVKKGTACREQNGNWTVVQGAA